MSGVLQAVKNTFDDSKFIVYNTADDTKKIDFDLSGITTGNTRTIAWPDRDFDFTNPVFGGDVTVGDDLLLASDSAVMSWGADGEVTVTHVHNSGLALNKWFSVGKATFEAHSNQSSIIQLGLTAAFSYIRYEDSYELAISNNSYDGKAVETGKSANYYQVEGQHGFQVSNGSDDADAEIGWITPLNIQNDGSIDVTTYQIGYSGGAGGLSFDSSNNGKFTDWLSVGKATFEAHREIYSILQIGGNGVLYSETEESAYNNTAIMHNSYIDNDGYVLAITTGQSTYYQQASGQHIFYVSNGSDDADAVVACISPFIIQNDGSIDLGIYQIGNDGSAGGLSFSAAHLATLTHGLTIGGNFIIPNAGYIGSASDTDAIQIEADGDVVLSQTLSAANPTSDSGKIVLTLDQADVDIAFMKFVGDAASGDAARDLAGSDTCQEVDNAVVGWFKIYIQDDGNQIADGAYYVPFYSLEAIPV